MPSQKGYLHVLAKIVSLRWQIRSAARMGGYSSSTARDFIVKGHPTRLIVQLNGHQLRKTAE